MKDNKLNALNISVMYIGAIMGAGFASGRETWQFFGVFGNWGIAGAMVFAILFMILGHIIRYNAKVLQTNNMGKIIVPGGNRKIEVFVETFKEFISHINKCWSFNSKHFNIIIKNFFIQSRFPFNMLFYFTLFCKDIKVF